MASACLLVLLALCGLHSTEALQKDHHIAPLQLPLAESQLLQHENLRKDNHTDIPNMFKVMEAVHSHIKNKSDDFFERPIFDPIGNQGALEITINTAQDANSFLVSVALNTFALLILFVVFSIMRYCNQPLYRREHCYQCGKATQNFCSRSFLTICQECDATGPTCSSFVDFDEVQATRCGCCDSPCMGWVPRVFRIQPEDEIEVAGLDAWSLLQVIRLNMQMWMILGPLLLVVLGSLHVFSCFRPHPLREVETGLDILGCLDASSIAPNSWLWWVHVAMVWIVVIVVTYMVGKAHDDFLNRRFHWLKAIPPPRSTTVMVENIPPEYRSDEALLDYFKDVFEGKGMEVLDAYIVRRTPVLRESVERLSNIQYHKKIRESAGKGWPEEMQAAESKALQDVREEQERVSAAATTRQSSYDETYCSSSGFVTFSTMIAQRLATRQQYTRDTTEFIVNMPPDPGDVIYSDLAQTDIGTVWEYLGSVSLMALFLLWSPVVIFISGFANLEQIGKHSKTVEDFINYMPTMTTLLQGFLSSAALRMFMAFLPNILFTIITSFYQLKAGAWAQFQLEKWYFAFLVIFVLLGPALGRSIIATTIHIIDRPSDVLYLLATSLPSASHFFMNYIVVGWTAAVYELLRVFNLAKYVWYRLRGLSIEEAKSFAEPEDPPAYGMGARMATMVLSSVITLVFCTISPIISVLSLVYFALCRVVYSQQLVFAECRKADLGGTFWVEALQQIYFGLVLFILLMTGVLTVNTEQLYQPIAGFMAVFPLLFKYIRFRALAWELLPLEQVAEAGREGFGADHAAKASFYRQPECDPDITKAGDVRRVLHTQPSKMQMDSAASSFTSSFQRQQSASDTSSPARGRGSDRGVPGG